MEGSRLDLESPIDDAISRIRFAPNSNNMVISSWDSSIRLYDVDGYEMRLEDFSEGALLDCCFQDESTALSATSDGCVRRTQTIVGKHDDSVIYVEFSEQTAKSKMVFNHSRYKKHRLQLENNGLLVQRSLKNSFA